MKDYEIIGGLAGTGGENYPCKDEIFRKISDPVGTDGNVFDGS